MEEMQDTQDVGRTQRKPIDKPDIKWIIDSIRRLISVLKVRWFYLFVVAIITMFIRTTIPIFCK